MRVSRDPDENVQLKLRFKEDLRRRLDLAASRNEASLNSEIVRRLEESLRFEETHGGPATAGLVQAILEDIAEIEHITGKSWAQDNETYAAVRRAIIAAVLDRPPTRVENHDEVKETLREAAARQKALVFAQDALSGMLVGALNGELLQQTTEQIRASLPEAEREHQKARAAAERAYEPQLAAERRGRRLYSKIRQQRKESRRARGLR